MKKWTTLERALTADGKIITLEEHDGSYAIRVDGIPLMSTRQHASEEKLAELACAHLRDVRHARVLIGGLGFGFTLKAALASLPAGAEVLVAELLGAVIAWNRNPELPLASAALADPRVTVRQEDAGDSDPPRTRSVRQHHFGCGQRTGGPQHGRQRASLRFGRPASGTRRITAGGLRGLLVGGAGHGIPEAVGAGGLPCGGTALPVAWKLRQMAHALPGQAAISCCRR